MCLLIKLRQANLRPNAQRAHWDEAKGRGEVEGGRRREADIPQWLRLARLPQTHRLLPPTSRLLLCQATQPVSKTAWQLIVRCTQLTEHRAWR